MNIAISPAAHSDDYVDSVRLAGGTPRLLDRERDAAADVVRDCAGLMLLGGPDVDPALYGEAPHETFQASEPGRDDYEIALIRHALERDLPLLAICRGVQVLNVALGGSLIQDIPSQAPSPLRHPKPKLATGEDAPKWTIAHDVTIDAESRLHAILRGQISADGRCGVNSRHHQAVKTAGRELRVSAMAPDGIIEAVERPASTFCVGVQWHPENFVGREDYNFAALFRAFVEAARGR